MSNLYQVNESGYAKGTIPMYSSAGRSIEDLERMLPEVGLGNAEWNPHPPRKSETKTIKYLLYVHDLTEEEFEESKRKLLALQSKYEKAGYSLVVTYSGKPKASSSGEPEGYEPGMN